MKMKVGLIQDRHPLPVEKYLLDADVAAKVGFHAGLYEEARRAARRVVVEDQLKPVREWVWQVDLYLTGLTIAALGACDGFRACGWDVTAWSYDRDSGEYQAIELAKLRRA